MGLIFLQGTLKDSKEIEIICNKETSDTKIKIQDYVRYDEGKEVGFSVAYYLDKFIDETFYGDVELGEKFKFSFMKQFLKKLEMDPLDNNDPDRDFKVGILDGFNFSWNRRIKKKELDIEKDKIIDEIKIIIKDINLPVQ